MILIGDIGNTEVKIFLLTSKKKIKKKFILKTKKISKYYINSKLNSLKIYSERIEKILFSSVVPSVYTKLKSYIKKKLKKNCNELKEKNLKKIINIKVNIKQVGSDRIANAISIIDNKKNYIIVDFGTATTFDIIEKNYYVGGIIAPGVNLSLETLITKASLIPYIKLNKISDVIGKNTKSAVRSGFYWGYIGLINEIINLIKKKTKKKYSIILTGGLSYLFKNKLKSNVIVNKDLTMKGLLKVVNN
tara:strand:- start:1009 stop:1749 length:741 start_codon:yes stop_codon:yes gene_type:complete